MSKVTNEQNIALVAKYREAKAAGDTGAARRIQEAIVTMNEGLVKRFGMRYGRPQSSHEKEDVFQAARIGILRALEDFEPSKGAFSTHAQWHIRDYVQRFTGKTAAVTRPRSASMPASVAKASREFRQRYGKEPTAEDLGISQEQMTEWSSATHFVELDSFSEERPEVELTYDANEAEHLGSRLDLRDAWGRAVATLSPRNVDIARSHFFEGLSHEDIAREQGMSRPRVTQICKRVETRLRRVLFPETYDPANDIDRKHALRSRLRYQRKRETQVPPSTEPAAESA